MDIDYAETRRATNRLAQLYDDLLAWADVGEPDTGDTPGAGPGEGGHLSTVAREAMRLAARLARLARALDGFSQEVRGADDAHAHRLAVLAAEEVR